ncbi:MAG: hypothetical protein JRG94_03920 [Deltaproteobacteria bacterium]|nr:hypothetical protein [Deltaproteobacteria bacterium]MBW2725605.1 hypothetical protein [Deltaproteobacteria bacterium]
MRNLEALDKLLLAVLLPLWFTCLVFHIKEIRRTGFAEPPIYASASTEGERNPIVGGFRLERGRGGEGLRLGDRLLRVGDTDLRGVGYIGFDAIALDEAGLALSTPLLIERDGVPRTVTLEMLPSGFPWYRVLPIVCWVLVSILILLRGKGSESSRLLFTATIFVAILATPFYGGPRIQSYIALTLFNLVGGLAFIFAIRWTITFPYEVAQRHRLSMAWSWLGSLYWIARIGYFAETPVPSQQVPLITIASDALFIIGMLIIVTRNYFYSEPIGRRRVKWILLAGYLGVLPLGLALSAQLLWPNFPYFDFLFEVGVMLFVIVPIGLLIAILRYNLYDIDRLISVTASYSAVAVVLLSAALTLLPRVANAASEVLGIETSTGQTMLSFLFAAAVVPAHRRIRPQIDRIFFRERHRIENSITSLLKELSDHTDTSDLTHRAGERLDELLRPETTTVYVRGPSGSTYEPAFVRGGGVPPAFEAESLLVSTLKSRHGPLIADDFADKRVEVSPFERAAIETLGVPIVLPIRRGDDLFAFLCLGPKQSGDVYTPTEVALLAAVADKMSSELLRYDLDQMLRSGRQMQAALRRYVPGAIAEQIEAGQDLSTGERDVTILFVDIRGYTTYSEGRQAEEIFSTVNRFTDTVSRIVREQGGCVVEFNGDGMMTVFGAPVALADKETHAILAGQAIFSAMERLDRDKEIPDAPQLSVGVGIATGKAFVGNIQAVDRLIWSAIGNTTNLAARLQNLTRDLGAAIVIDAPTYRSASLNTDHWVHYPGSRIRGRSESVDLYMMPLPPAQSSP